MLSRNRSYYSAPIEQFIAESEKAILGDLVHHHSFPTDELQRNSWIYQIQLFQKELGENLDIDGFIFFEFAIPRMGKRVDTVVLHKGIIFVIEFKVGESMYSRSGTEQVEDYGLDLKNFHSGSHDKLIVPILAATAAKSQHSQLVRNPDGLYEVLRVNSETLIPTIRQVGNEIREPNFDAEEWAKSIYKPTPTIIEAAQALYRGHSVSEITRSDSGAKNLSRTSAAIDEIIRISKELSQKSICFVTGVPGSGKTLAGLNIANERHNIDEGEHAVFLSGNGPLVSVLREALARNRVSQAQAMGESIPKSKATSETEAFIQNIHHFRDDNIQTDEAPVERVVVFDEAQRAWTFEQTNRFMKRRKGISNFNQSEPEFLISVLDRHEGYAVIVCLIGGGQEINTGEAGISEWFRALAEKFHDWKIYASGNLHGFEYGQGANLYEIVKPGRLEVVDDLHLSTSVRSYRSEAISDLVQQILDGETQAAAEYVARVSADYPIVLTRDLDVARKWLRWKARGSERYGIVASSGALRLKPLGLNIKAKIDPVNWFLDDKSDVRSSFYLEDAATEFDVQGLELDWACVAWDVNFFRSDGEWICRKFSGTKWKAVRDELSRSYLKNAYRVLLTRARQGMVIFIPLGSETDATRDKARYDSVAGYLAELGIQKL